MGSRARACTSVRCEPTRALNGAKRMTVVVSVVRQVGEDFTHCIVGVSWKIWPHAMSDIVVVRVTAGGAGQTNVDRIPQRPVGQIVVRLIARASLTKECLTGPVM